MTTNKALKTEEQKDDNTEDKYKMLDDKCSVVLVKIKGKKKKRSIRATTNE
jgi:hypothetical protein